MLQSVSVHLMDERRQSRLAYEERRARRGTHADIVVSSHHLCPPQWYGVGIIEDFQPTAVSPTDNPIGWAVFNPLPIRGPSQRPRNRAIENELYPIRIFKEIA
ncbi:hypothetical protein OESDEN_03061 [Oesophagostomum dentatum]|uniref:Uncharacterized protein n=1 Tax=Oesophagostomum dentatum TaxID=61180 RepID=A0A0B1TI86_OESDE|nr:hypothetical protein OESDEN_03061 [Oesophagostomum dentatum]